MQCVRAAWLVTIRLVAPKLHRWETLYDDYGCCWLSVDAGLSMMKHFLVTPRIVFEPWRVERGASTETYTSYNEDDIDKKKGSGPDATKWLEHHTKHAQPPTKPEKTFPSLSRVFHIYTHTNAYTLFALVRDTQWPSKRDHLNLYIFKILTLGQPTPFDTKYYLGSLK